VMASLSSCLERAVTVDELRAPVVRQLSAIFNREFSSRR
jgi:hypothetical protein